MSLSDELFKVIVVGDACVGKTSFITRYVEGCFRMVEYKPTIGVDFALKILPWSSTEFVRVQLWDIAGQDRFAWITRVYYKDSQGCAIMFDLSSRTSFLSVPKWKRDVDEKCRLDDGSPIPCVLLANKCDIPRTKRQVRQSEIECMQRDEGFIGWTEVSAKDGIMVMESM
ncbi:unnamed protein product, partial [Cyprideis torosa]